jgi:uncharacterized protein
MLLLAGLGLVNTTFFFWGEILFTYAVFGVLLALFFKSNFRFIITSAVVVYVLVHPIWVVHFSEGFANCVNPIMTDVYQAEDVFRIYREGSLAEMIALRWREYITLFTLNDEYMRTSFTLILLGLGLGKYGYLKRFLESIEHQHKWLILSGIIGGVLALFTLATGIYSIRLRVNPPVSIALSIWRLATTYFYIHLFFLLYRKTQLKPVLNLFSYVGRMSLTNYMLSACVYAFIYHNMGLGLYAKLPVWTEVPIASGLYILCLVFSWKWLNTHPFGPVEWVWRSFSYKKRQAISYTQR